jgi:hypothetical protein
MIGKKMAIAVADVSSPRTGLSEYTIAATMIAHRRKTSGKKRAFPVWRAALDVLKPSALADGGAEAERGAYRINWISALKEVATC